MHLLVSLDGRISEGEGAKLVHINGQQLITGGQFPYLIPVKRAKTMPL